MIRITKYSVSSQTESHPQQESEEVTDYETSKTKSAADYKTCPKQSPELRSPVFDMLCYRDGMLFDESNQVGIERLK